MVDFTTTFVDHSVVMPYLTYAYGDNVWDATAPVYNGPVIQADYVELTPIGMIPRPDTGILWPPR